MKKRLGIKTNQLSQKLVFYKDQKKNQQTFSQTVQKRKSQIPKIKNKIRNITTDLTEIKCLKNPITKICQKFRYIEENGVRPRNPQTTKLIHKQKI